MFILLYFIYLFFQGSDYKNFLLGGLVHCIFHYWKPHIKYIENEIVKNIDLLCKARPFLNKKSLISLYYLYIHSHINYGSFSWGSTCETNFENINSIKSTCLATYLIKANSNVPATFLNLTKFLTYRKIPVIVPPVIITPPPGYKPIKPETGFSSRL